MNEGPGGALVPGVVRFSYPEAPAGKIKLLWHEPPHPVNLRELNYLPQVPLARNSSESSSFTDLKQTTLHREQMKFHVNYR